ncbi:hypothetical protein CLV92_11761 [Kineococcus xinjiangensis]|uniref:Alpha/beta hydrolase domain-containing protein n=1 Tax=Kineococcus xinjiangensis TaxID=512762 RepID=A0A2S6ID21_9ACTN|nr:alpha/beta hydrolase domain-containing protein [Kineococcus xinjiangensis]PPK92096.1 hypothetical protein CLV92_11761 [Kineococcus xinjiangensis]
MPPAHPSPARRPALAPGRALRGATALACAALLAASVPAQAAPGAAGAGGGAQDPAAANPAAVPALPEVTGPLPVTATSHPFGGALHQRIPQDLRRSGYVEEEFLVSGRANVYDWPQPGPAVVRTEDAPYTTRILVRRPADRADFSGNVVVEVLNPSNLFDLNIGWALSGPQMMRDGDVWVGITGKPVAIEALKTFDPERYGSLSFANPLPLDDPRNCTDLQTLIRGDSKRTTENGLVWDVNSQVAAWLRSDAPSNPLRYGTPAGGRSPVEKLYAFGYSQTGGFLYTYVNAIAPLDVRRYGRHLFDGYVIGVAGGAFAGASSINQCSPRPAADDPRNQIRDAGVPVIHVMSQSDFLLGIASRREDGNSPRDPFRHYEVPGMGHATPEELHYSAAPEDIVKAGRTIPAMSCADGPRSRFPSSLVFDAALRNLDRWSRDRVAPPRGTVIDVRDAEPVADEFGNLVGGYRTPYVDVPTSTWHGRSAGGGFCFIAGHEDPFDEERLRALYPSHDAYVDAVRRDTRRLVARRYLTAEDGRAVVEQAEASGVPGSPVYHPLTP